MTATALLIAGGRRRRDGLDAQRQGLERQVRGAGRRPLRRLPAGCLIDGEAVALGDGRQARLPAAPGDAEGRQGADLAFYAFDLLVDRARTSPSCPTSSARRGSRRCSRRVPPPILYGDHVVGKGEALFDAICARGRRGHHRQEGRRALPRGRGRATGSRSNAPAPGVRDRRLAGERQSAAASPRCCSAATTAAGCAMPARSAPASTRNRGPERADGAAERSTKPAARRCRAPSARGRTGSSPSWWPRSPSPNSPATGLRHPSFLGLREDKKATEVVPETPSCRAAEEDA